MSVTAIVIARGGSERLPGKNLRHFFGRPLVAHKVWQLKQAKAIDRVIVGTDSEEIAQESQREGAEVRMRLPEFCDEKSRSWNEVIHDMVSQVPGDIIVWAHCTNPCIQPATYDRAVAKFYESTGDSVVSVHPIQTHVWYRDRPLNFDPQEVPHRVARELEAVFIQNGGIFVAYRNDMQSLSYVYGPHPSMLIIDALEGTDIDTQADWEQACRVYPEVVAKHEVAHR